METAKIVLFPEVFSEKEKVLFEQGELSASVFRFASGVCALRLKNRLGNLVLLPYQGQQIWSVELLGRNLTMVSMFDQPRPTQKYLETYGSFLVHCGANTMGVPGKEDTHALHGELPNAPYQEAYLVSGEDEEGPFIGLGGKYQHTVAFNLNYLAEPLVKLYAGSSLFTSQMQVTNLKNTSMDLMVLEHVNFRPVNGSQLVYAAHPTPEHVRVRRSIPSHVTPKPGYAEFLDELAANPALHHRLTPELAFDPEVVFLLDYLPDEDGWAHSLQVHPQGTSDYIAFRPAELNKAMRWICRTADQDALGMVLPGTAEPEGYLAEKAKGNVLSLGPKEKFIYHLRLGALDQEATRVIQKKITAVLQS